MSEAADKSKPEAGNDYLRDKVYEVNALCRNPPLTGSYPYIHAKLLEVWNNGYAAGRAVRLAANLPTIEQEEKEIEEER